MAFAFETPTATASEGDGASEFCVILQTGVLTTPITVTLNAQSGTATGKKVFPISCDCQQQFLELLFFVATSYVAT